jgi:hypothetical protein
MSERDEKGLTDHSYADIPLMSEGWLFAALLDMVLEHCSVPGDKIDSFIGYPANVTAMRLLAEAGFIEIESEEESPERLVAHVLPAAQELTARASPTD